MVIAPLGPAAEAKALGIARALRRAGIAVEQDYRGNMKRRMQRANKLNARAAVIIGDDELAKGVAQLKDLDSGEQREVALDKLMEALKPSRCPCCRNSTRWWRATPSCRRRCPAAASIAEVRRGLQGVCRPRAAGRGGRRMAQGRAAS